jgi:membrane protein DedA with SNARE-associated domain
VPDDLPLVPTILFLFVVALGRAGLTYAIARWLRNAAGHRAAFLDRPSVARAEQTVRRFGAPAVTLSFLTIGVQTAVNAAAGALRMPLVVYLPALAAGAALWAVLYATVGLAAAAALLGRLSPILLGLAVVAVVVVALATSYGRRRKSASRS